MSADSGPRVRFAPSPTGHLHIGGARTALFNWLYARKVKGKFILRVEDTDLKRSSREMSNEILNEMAWLGLDWDEGPFFQSERMKQDRYLPHAQVLLEQGLAYRDGDAIIYQVKKGEDVIFFDLVRDKITTSTDELKDIVLIKSDGSPAYNFACVVDDHEMGITHIIRGEDHIPNTPKQVLLYQALGWKLPKFAHLPLILGEDKSPLSKRHGATSLSAFRRQGYVPAALINYLSLLGWSPGDGREFMSVPEIIKSFSLKRIIKRAAVFDYQKLKWLNGQHLRKMDLQIKTAAAQEVLKEWLEQQEIEVSQLRDALKLMGHRIRLLGELPQQADYLFNSEIQIMPDAQEKYWTVPGIGDLLIQVRDRLASLDDFSHPQLEGVLGQLLADRQLKTGDLFHPVRVALTGRADSPGIFEVLEFLGQKRALQRLDAAVRILGS